MDGKVLLKVPKELKVLKVSKSTLIIIHLPRITLIIVIFLVFIHFAFMVANTWNDSRILLGEILAQRIRNTNQSFTFILKVI